MGLGGLLAGFYQAVAEIWRRGYPRMPKAGWGER
jgi:hypothetical protein